jgi:regulator of protease activity HflC (stomatin/prohibitin superfamily)
MLKLTSRRLSTTLSTAFDHYCKLTWGESIVRLMGIPLFPLGIYSVPQNHVCVIQYFGKLHEIKEAGLRCNLPIGFKYYNIYTGFQSRNINSSKVLDKEGNPIIVSALVNYQIINPIKYTYDVTHGFIDDQINSAIKVVSSKYSYEELRKEDTNITTHAKELTQSMVNIAGCLIHDVKFTNLSYAPEIAQCMLVKQQADAQIHARELISQAAVTITKKVLEQMDGLSENAKESLIINLTTVLCSQEGVKPVIDLK